jgi:hypothetical protein
MLRLAISLFRRQTIVGIKFLGYQQLSIIPTGAHRREVHDARDRRHKRDMWPASCRHGKVDAALCPGNDAFEGLQRGVEVDGPGVEDDHVDVLC